ncbi:hypothetical protein MLD38_016180 [Melastoma candidum]|uniref:Uncharacterized protein n=1 Tax=Melastoma candidum TaxID=119954 RepID=A0ACB9RJS0_9MYRT|nr:hypothetical protein MLD38_016180 [Melastoma candidum]
MWQFLLAAAVAGSTGFVANHLFQHPTPTTNPFVADRPTSQGDGSFHHLPPPGDEVFRFSSPGSGEKPRKKGKMKNKKTEEAEEEDEEDKSTQKIELGGRGSVMGLGDEMRKVGRGRRKVHVCLKRRKTGKNCEKRPQCGSCLSKDGSFFNWGLGLGLMHMLSAEKSEIRKLNAAVDETVKVVKELKTELYSSKIFMGEKTHVLDVSLSNKSQKTIRSADDVKLSGQIASHEGECASSVLIEELHDFKMTELEAELESQLQKLPWSMAEASSTDESKMGTGASGERLHEQADESLGLHYSNGVLPHLLKQKPSHVLIQQQEKHIVELESELHSTRSKLNEKEAELRALKDCVRRLSNISLSAESDEE